MEGAAQVRRLADRYLLEELIAKGGMASVWRAQDGVLARTVAVKMLRRDLARDPQFLERFRMEAVAAARLTHPSIISVYDTGIDDDDCYIVMEHFGARTLRDLVDHDAPVAPEEAVDLVLPVLDALDFAHGAGVVHRDVKPANILVGADGRVKVTDFGIAKAVFSSHDLTTTGAVLGTVRYLSPEQVQGTEVGPAADLYAVGVILYELLTGRPPFQAASDVATAMMRLTTVPPRPSDIRPGIPRSLESMVMRALERRTEDRYTTASAMRSALERHGTGGPPTPPRGIPVAAAAGSTQLTGGVTPPGPDGPAFRAGQHAAIVAPPAHRGLFRSWMLVPLLVVLVAAMAILAGLALGRLELGGPLGIRPAPTSPGKSSGQPHALTITQAQDFDPEGDGTEHPEDAALAIDGDTATSWATDHYSSAAFGNLKDGLGLWISFGGERSVDRLTIQSDLPGWAFELHPGTSPDAGGDPVRSNGATTFAMPGSGTLEVSFDPVNARGILIWITQLASDGGRYAASISEVSVEGSS